MSGLVLHEHSIVADEIKSKTIQVKRCVATNMGVRMWYQILSTDGEMYQKWAMLMNNTEEVLLLTQPGDSLDITYIDDVVEDTMNHTFDSFNRKVILTAAFTNKLLLN